MTFGQIRSISPFSLWFGACSKFRHETSSHWHRESGVSGNTPTWPSRHPLATCQRIPSKKTHVVIGPSQQICQYASWPFLFVGIPEGMWHQVGWMLREVKAVPSTPCKHGGSEWKEGTEGWQGSNGEECYIHCSEKWKAHVHCKYVDTHWWVTMHDWDYIFAYIYLNSKVLGTKEFDVCPFEHRGLRLVACERSTGLIP